MKFRAITLFLLCIILAAFSGCKTKKPSPEMTLPDASANADYVAASGAMGAGANGSDLVGEGADGLLPRDAGFGDKGNQMRGVLPSVYFDFNQAAIKQSERPKLDQAFQYLQSNPADKLLIEGYCDWRGTAEYNLALGDRRAAGVKQFLTQLGIDAARLEVLSKGDLEAVTDGTEEQMSKDRRADLVVVKPVAP